jgi:hypothetical protein
MNSNPVPEDKDPLRNVLREWVVDTPLPPRFEEQVWRRIARAEAESAAALGTRFRRWLEVVLPRPKAAFAFVAILLVLGTAAGSLTAQIRSSHMDATLSARYVQSVDPNQIAALQP